jgi:molybdenum storage protein
MSISSSETPDRKAIHTPLSNETFASRRRLDKLSYGKSFRILPDVNVIKIGGQSVMDRGKVILPLIDEIAECAKKHDLLLGAGGGTRARHAYSLCLDFDLPTGILASVGAATARQNARMLQMLLAKHGGIYLNPDDFPSLPLFFRVGCIPIMEGMPPYDLWEKPPRQGRIPPNRTDSGVYLAGEVLGARKVIFVKDEDGLYTDDPKRNKNAEFIPRISVQELFERDLADMVLEKVVFENMLRADHVREVQVINGFVPGNLTRALDGEPVGTVIYVDDE